MKYVDVEGVVTNNRFIAEEIKSDKVENVVMEWIKSWNFFGKIERQQNLKSVVMDGPKVGEFGKVGVGTEQKLKSIVMDRVRSGKENEVKNVVIGWSQNWKSWEIGEVQN